MNAQLLAVVAVGMIALGVFGLIGLWAYSRMTKVNRRVKRRNSDLIVSHTFKKRKRRTLRTALAASAPSMPSLEQPAADHSRWQRPGFKPSVDPSFRAPMPIYEPDKPRHVFIAHTPSVVIPHETVGPEPRAPQPRLSQRTQRSQKTVLIKTVRIEQSYQPNVRAASDSAVWPVQASVRRDNPA